MQSLAQKSGGSAWAQRMMELRRMHAASALLALLLLLLSFSLEQARALDQRLLFRDGLQPRGQPGGYDGAYEVVRAGLRRTPCCLCSSN